MLQLYSHTCGKCGGTVPAAAGGINLEKLFKRAAKAVYKDKADEMMSKLEAAFAASIGKEVQQGYGKQLFDVKWNSPDAQMIRHLQANVYEFSSAKSYQQLRAMTNALFDKDGKLVPEKEFLDIAKRINNEMGVTHLKTERNTAIAGGQMASKWVQYQAEKESLPLLTYQTVGDGNVRPEHAELDNITRPVDDAFWRVAYPPNGWNCRCTVTQATGGRKITADENIPAGYADTIPSIFRTNLSEEGMVFPEDHPYYYQLPPALMKAAGNRNPFSYNKIITTEKGYVYNSVISRATAEEIETARILAMHDKNVVLLPIIQPDTEWQQELRRICIPSVTPKDKNADSMVNGKLVEFKYSKQATATSIDKHLREGAKQADIVCLRLGADITDALLKATILQRVKRNALKEVWLIRDNKLVQYTRKQILKWK